MLLDNGNIHGTTKEGLVRSRVHGSGCADLESATRRGHDVIERLTTRSR
jgi:hypothetical protein